MDRIFRRLKLLYKLNLLLLLPSLLFAGVFIYFFRDGLKDHVTGIVISLLAAGILYVLASLYYRRLATSVETLKHVTQELASGNYSSLRRVNGVADTAVIGQTILQLTEDLARQSHFAEQLKAGNLDAVYEPRSEQDAMGKALIHIKQNLIAIKAEDQQRNWSSDGLAKFVQVLQSASNLKALSNDIIVNLVRIIKANQGALFLAEKDNETDQERLEMQACYAYNRSKHFSRTIAVGEGLVGQAYLERRTIYLKEVPDRFVRITSGLGEANPRFVLIVPLRMTETIVGIIELASFKDFSSHEIEFAEKIGESIAYTVASIRTSERTRRMVDELNEQAEQMRSQEEELKQNQEELQATQETISRKYDALFKKLGELNYQSKFDQLRSITSTKKRNVEYYFDIIRSQILTFSEDMMIVQAVREFKNAFYHLGNDLPRHQLSTYQSGLRQYYDTEFIPRLNDNTNFATRSDDFIPKEDRVCELQYLYVSNNPHPTGKKSLLDDAGDGSEYSKVHSRYHPIIRNFLERFGYYDIFLIDVQSGDMMYSVFKEVDFATSLLTGLYSKTNFGRVVRNAIESTDRNFVQLIDFEPYDPSYHAPASFIACPIFDGVEKIGIVVFQMPINKINQILTGNNKWREDGLGDSGETFMLGGDYKLRSISRPLIEDIDGHIDRLKSLHYDGALLQQIRKMETSILMEEIRQDSAAKALAGGSGTQLEKNSTGLDVLTAFAPLEIPDVHWVIMSTMTEEEASTPINSLRGGDFE